MRNSITTEKMLAKKYANHFFHSIVFENVINALPLNKDSMTNAEAKKLFQFTGNVVESIGGIDAVSSAIDIENKTLEQNMFIADLYTICMESAKECAKEKCNDPNLCKEKDTFQEVVDKATLSKADCEKFTKRAKSIDFKEIADIIKKKTLAVISDEKEQYKKEKEIDEELQSALSDDTTDISAEESTDCNKLDNIEKGKAKASMNVSKHSVSANGPSTPVKAIESFKDTYLERNDPRHHVSLFSRLQETAMEMMSFIKTPNYGRDYFPILEAVTYESGFVKKNEKTSVATEASSIAKEEICDIPRQTQPKVATLVSIITYTIMETLHTMGILNIPKDKIRRFVDTGSDAEKFKGKTLKEACGSIQCAVKESAMIDFSKLSSQKLSNHLTRLKTALESAQAFIDQEGASTDIINTASEAVTYINKIEGIMSQRAKDFHAMSEATESYQTKLEKENDIAEFNRIASKLFNINKNVCIKVNDGNSTTIKLQK